MAADALDRLVVEARLGEGKAEQFEGVLARLVEGGQRSGKAVAIGIERQANGIVLEFGPERLAVIGAGTFVQQAGDHVGPPSLPSGSEAAPPSKNTDIDRKGIEGSLVR